MYIIVLQEVKRSGTCMYSIRGQEVRHMYVQSDTTDYNVVTSHTSEALGHFQSNSVVDCSWQRYVLTARKASFAGGEKTQVL